MMDSIIKTYDVVILTYEPRDTLIETLSKLMRQSIEPRVIYICNTCKENFYKNIENKELFDDILSGGQDKRFKDRIKVTHIIKSEFDHGKTRNEMLKLSNSDYVLFLTHDAVPYNEYLSENLLSAFDEYALPKTQVAVSYAKQIASDTASLKERLIREYNYPSHDIVKEKAKEQVLGIKNYFCSNVCAMYDREIFNKLGGFEENIILNEDTFYSYKAIQNGYRIVYRSNAKVIHSHDYTYKEQFSRNFDIGVSQSEKKEIFDKIPSEKEGFRLIIYVLKKMLLRFHFVKAIDFLIECFYRYLGFSNGKKYKQLDNDTCIKFASNKQYFMQKEQK